MTNLLLGLSCDSYFLNKIPLPEFKCIEQIFLSAVNFSLNVALSKRSFFPTVKIDFVGQSLSVPLYLKFPIIKKQRKMTHKIYAFETKIKCLKQCHDKTR